MRLSMGVAIAILYILQLFKQLGATVDWQDCGTTVIVTDLRITGCNQQPCIFYQGREYRMEFDAIPMTSSLQLPYTVKAQFVFPWTIMAGDACDELSNGNCPLIAQGRPFTFFKDFSIDMPFLAPSTLPTTITAQMNDDAGNILLCAILQVVIKHADLDPDPKPQVGETREEPSFNVGFFNFFRS